MLLFVGGNCWKVCVMIVMLSVMFRVLSRKGVLGSLIGVCLDVKKLKSFVV